jgi:hypothetical protein
MRCIQLVAAVAVLSLSTHVSAKHLSTKREVAVENLTFKVEFDDKYATTSSKGSWMYAPVGARYYSLARKAVEIASGCKLIETSTYRAKLYATIAQWLAASFPAH